MEVDIFSAAAYGEFETIADLLQSSSNPIELINSQDSFGLTPLMEACRNNRKDTVQFLLQHSASPNTRDKNGYTALHYAATDAHLDIIHMLVDNGADINQIDLSGRTPLHYASSKERDDVVQYLISKDADMTIRDKEGSLPISWMNVYKYKCCKKQTNI